MKPDRLISADEFEAAICKETHLSIECITTVLRVLRECRTVERAGNHMPLPTTCRFCGAPATKRAVLFDDVVDVCDAHFG